MRPDCGRVLAALMARCQLLPPGAPYGAPGRARLVVAGGGGASVAVVPSADGFGRCLAARGRALVNRASKGRLGPAGFVP